jgi:TRAP-type C4-dicarboxylate transport system substrate-binding protein
MLMGKKKKSKTVHCSICQRAISGPNFETRMAKLRRHRKRKHPKAHKKSVKKSLKTRMNPALATVLTVAAVSKQAWDNLPEDRKRKIHDAVRKGQIQLARRLGRK